MTVRLNYQNQNARTETGRMTLASLQTVVKAALRIQKHIQKTPVLRCSTLDNIVGAEVFFKAEVPHTLPEMHNNTRGPCCQ